MTRPQFVAHPNGIENLHATGRRSNEVLRPKLRKDPRDHFSDRTDAVREILLIHQRRQLAARSRTRRREVEEMPRDTWRTDANVFPASSSRTSYSL